jgi:Dyp-type peroxidase family
LDVLLTVFGSDERARDTLVGTLQASSAGLRPLHDRSLALLPAARPDPGRGSCITDLAREHFGFSDGCSQPAIEGIDDDPVGDGVHARDPPSWPPPLRWLEALAEDLGLKAVRRSWRPVKAGEFLLGHTNEEGELPEGPPAPLGPNGTFMVYRELRQDVRAFNDYISARAAALRTTPGWEQVSEDFVRAKLMGRWPDGTPLMVSPDAPDPVVANNRRRANDFLYRDDGDGRVADPEGLRCPLGAHVRRTNPRDGLPGGAERTARHRIIRRGMPYGPPYSERDADTPRGLAFVCLQASITSGFEFIQRRWGGTGQAFGLGGDRDLLLTHAPANVTGTVVPMAGGASVVLAPPAEPVVTVQGCEYLFVPSRTACEWLVSRA